MMNLLFFLIGLLLGGIIGVVLMSLLQINRINQRKDYSDEKKKC